MSDKSSHPLVQFVVAASSNLQSVLARPLVSKKTINHRKYLERHLLHPSATKCGARRSLPLRKKTFLKGRPDLTISGCTAASTTAKHNHDGTRAAHTSRDIQDLNFVQNDQNASEMNSTKQVHVTAGGTNYTTILTPHYADYRTARDHTLQQNTNYDVMPFCKPSMSSNQQQCDYVSLKGNFLDEACFGNSFVPPHSGEWEVSSFNNKDGAVAKELFTDVHIVDRQSVGNAEGDAANTNETGRQDLQQDLLQELCQDLRQDLLPLANGHLELPCQLGDFCQYSACQSDNVPNWTNQAAAILPFHQQSSAKQQQPDLLDNPITTLSNNSINSQPIYPVVPVLRESDGAMPFTRSPQFSHFESNLESNIGHSSKSTFESLVNQFPENVLQCEMPMENNTESSHTFYDVTGIVCDEEISLEFLSNMDDMFSMEELSEENKHDPGHVHSLSCFVE